jgi:imidazole glycerol-phosphate synthase subunit HisH
MEKIMQKVGVLSYGVGNVGSILNMLKRAGVQALAITEPDQLHQVDRLVLPGVGSFDGVKAKLVSSNLIPVLEQKVMQDHMPILGMQVMFEGSQEGMASGLGWLPGQVVRFSSEQKIKIPHVGWNIIGWSKNLEQLASFNRFYFTHSYHVVPENKSIIMAQCNYGGEFVVAVKQNNIIAVQFHPEKSHKNGMNLLQLFSSGALDS